MLLFQTYNIILYVHTFLFCWHFSYRTCAFSKACSDWFQLPLAALHINRHRVTSKICLTMPRVKMSRADRNPWLAKMHKNWTTHVDLLQNGHHHLIECNFWSSRYRLKKVLKQQSLARSVIFLMVRILCFAHFNIHLHKKNGVFCKLILSVVLWLCCHPSADTMVSVW